MGCGKQGCIDSDSHGWFCNPTRVAARDIAETIGRRLKLPVKSVAAEEAPAYFGWLAHLAARDMPASSEQTRKKLGWRPTGPTLIADLERLPLSAS